MIRYLRQNEINKSRWDECIASSPNGIIFSYSWYLDICCDKWDALVDDDYASVLPLPFKTKFRISYIYQPFFTRHLVVTSKNKITHRLTEEFYNEMPAHFKYLDFCTDQQDKNVFHGFKIKEKKFQFLQLSGYDKIRKKYSENLKRNLKKAGKNNFRISSGISPEEIISQFKKNKEELGLFTNQDFQRLNKLMNYCAENNSGFVRVVLNEKNKICASAFFMKSNNRIIYLKGSSSEEGKKSGAMHFLMDNVINEFASTEMIFDFGGSSVSSVARFFKSFGASDFVYLHLQKNRLPAPIRWLK